MGLTVVRTDQVALLAEGVDRNTLILFIKVSRYWVALLTEGVDRNHITARYLQGESGRPPRGGRG